MKTRLLIAICLFVVSRAFAQVPVPNFNANRTSGCAPLVVTFTDASTNDPKFWNWDFGNGELSTLKNPTVTYRQPGVYTVKLVVRNADGTNGIEKEDYIVVYPSPSAGFSASATSACAPSTIRFTDLSTTTEGTITEWLWNFGDGTTSTEQNPSHVYSEPGFYTVSLRVTSSTGCTSVSTRARMIRIVPGVEADFVPVLPQDCNPPFAVNFLNQSSGPGELTHRWDFGDAKTSTATNPVNLFEETGDFAVRLITSSEFGCADTIVKTLPLSGIAADFSGNDSLCLGSTASFTNTSGQPAVTSTWFLNDIPVGTGNSLTRTFNSTGVFRLKLVNHYQNCVDSVTREIRVIEKPEIDFTSSDPINCSAPFTVNFTDNTPNARSWFWDFGDGNTSTEQHPSHTYTQLGNFNVSLGVTDAFGCTDTLTLTNMVRLMRPQVRITNAGVGGCAPFSYTPVGQATGLSAVTSWVWDFGNGNTHNGQIAPTQVYTIPGNYVVRLTITTEDGCTETVTTTIRVGTPVSPEFEADKLEVCAGDEIQFTNLTSGGNQWIWDFGNGDTSHAEHPLYTYQGAGIYDVGLTVINNGCPTTVTKTAYVQSNPPVAEFTWDNSCENLTLVNFTNTSILPATGNVEYFWDFGNGMTSTEENPSVQYGGPGTYEVRLRVTDGNCTNEITKTLRLQTPNPGFNVSTLTPCRAENFTLTAIETNRDLIASYEWKIGNFPAVSGGPTYTRRLDERGTYEVYLTLTDTNGCIYTSSATVLNVVGPTASFNVTDRTVCYGETVEFNDLSSSDQNITLWRFDYGDGTIVDYTQPGNFTHLYTDTGYFTVRLSVQDPSGCSSLSTRTDFIYVGRPKAVISPEPVISCPDVPIQFAADSSEGRNLTFMWDFGNGTTASGMRVQNIYTGGDADYNVSLKVTDTIGCADSVFLPGKVIIISPKASFTTSDTLSICPPLETIFTNTSQDYQRLYWKFDNDPDSSIAENPRYFFNDYGTFEVKLYTVGYGGCMDSASQKVHIVNPNTTRINYSPLTNCNELNVTFDIQPPNDLRFIFSFGDGSQDSSQNRSLQHYYGSPANYNPSILLMDKVGCQASLSAGPTIRVIGAQPLFGVDKKEFCDSGTVFFTNYTIGNDPVVSWRWEMGDNTVYTTNENQEHHYTQPGVYAARLWLQTAQGCENSITDTIRVYATPHTNIFSKDTICVNDLALFSSELIRPDTGVISYRWTLGNGSSSSMREASTTYTSTGNYTVSLQTRNTFGCEANTSKMVNVVPLPGIEPLDNPVMFAGGNAVLRVNYSGPIVNYNWSPPGGLSCTDCPEPIASPRKTTTYTITVEDSYGCKNSEEVTVTVVCGGRNLFIPNTFSPNADGRNDYFYPRGTGLERIQSFRIFNRWGEQVFSKTNFPANDPSHGWDGTVKGKAAGPDVYVYTIEIVCDNGEVFRYSGNVMLIR